MVLPLLSMLATMAFCSRALAASPALPLPEGPGTSERRDEPALLEVFNRPIAVFRGTQFGYTPSRRVKGMAERIAAILGRRIYGPVASEPRTEGMVITIGGEPALAVLPGDIDPLGGKTLDGTVQEIMQQLKPALQEAKLQRSKGYLLLAVSKASGATLIFLALCLLLGRVRRHLLPRLLHLEQRLAKRLSARGLMRLGQVVQVLRWMLHLVLWVLLLALTSEWASICLRLFPYTRPWGDTLQENLRNALLGLLHALAEALPNLLVIVVILVLARGAVMMLSGFFKGVETGEVKPDWMDVEAARATRRILTIIVWLLALVMIYPYIPGSGSSAFKGMSVFVGLLLSLGSSGVVGQFTSGLMLMYSRALKPGEYVRIGEHEGTVESLGFLSTKIRSPKNEELHVPNTVILGTTVKNYSRLAKQGGLLVHTSVTIGYDAPWRQVHALLIQAANNTRGISPEPPPFVLQTALSDFYVEYQINAALANPQGRVEVLGALHANIQDQFNAHGVQIMSPHYEGDKSQPVVVPRAKWFTPPAAPDPPPPPQPIH